MSGTNQTNDNQLAGADNQPQQPMPNVQNNQPLINNPAAGTNQDLQSAVRNPFQNYNAGQFNQFTDLEGFKNSVPEPQAPVLPVQPIAETQVPSFEQVATEKNTPVQPVDFKTQASAEKTVAETAGVANVVNQPILAKELTPFQQQLLAEANPHIQEPAPPVENVANEPQVLEAATAVVPLTQSKKIPPATPLVQTSTQTVTNPQVLPVPEVPINLITEEQQPKKSNGCGIFILIIVVLVIGFLLLVLGILLANPNLLASLTAK